MWASFYSLIDERRGGKDEYKVGRGVAEASRGNYESDAKKEGRGSRVGRSAP